ncbi:MAG: TonB-dependent receptor [Ignavibacteria bacterium]|nr:TonB-dependent receptor [Ignavibacteria bacterium]
MPTLMIQHKFSQQSNLRMFYRTSTSAPSITQLQNVVDNSNPVQLRIGNPNLAQEYSHSFNARVMNSNWMAGKTMFGVLNLNYTANYIGTANVITQNDSVIGNNVVVGPGTDHNQRQPRGYVECTGLLHLRIPCLRCESQSHLRRELYAHPRTYQHRDQLRQLYNRLTRVLPWLCELRRPGCFCFVQWHVYVGSQHFATHGRR